MTLVPTEGVDAVEVLRAVRDAGFTDVSVIIDGADQRVEVEGVPPGRETEVLRAAMTADPFIRAS